MLFTNLIFLKTNVITTHNVIIGIKENNLQYMEIVLMLKVTTK